MPQRTKATDARLHYAASNEDADMLYATGFFAPDPFWFLEHRGKKMVFLHDLEVDRGRHQLCGIEVVAWSELEQNLGSRKRNGCAVQIMARYLRKLGIRSVEVPARFPLGIAKKLAACGVVCKVKDGAFFPERERKSETEIRYIAQAQRVAQVAMARAKEILGECKWRKDKVLRWRGRVLDSGRLRAELQAVLAQQGAHCERLIVAGGEEACDPHEIGSKELYAEQMIVVDIFPRILSTGYWGDLTRTFCVGEPRAELAAVHAAVLAAQKKALAQICEGCQGKALQEEIRAFFSARGYITGVQDGRNVGFFHGLGHGVGLEIHEAPRFSDGKLRAGHVITVEPGLYYPGLGGVRIEDLVVVTQEGYRNLTSFPKDWRIQ